jgi:tetratricopeptide (TPR) repeat protein
MIDEPRVQELLDELLDRWTTPEDVCGDSCPELLPVVRERWRQIRRAQAELDAIFPPPVLCDALPTFSTERQPLPAVPGYEVQAVLGQGGMGIVFRARHLRLGRVVALKMEIAGSYTGLLERERFRREAQAVAALRHPNVVQVYDVGDADGRPYFTMEFMEGGSLADRLSGTPQSARPAAELIATLGEAVEAAHQSGVVHRDLKPGNVLLTADGIPKISDFGLARRLDHGSALTRTGAPLGTPSYMAPEQAEGKSNIVGPATDIYALGTILYELMTGRPPFKAEAGAETLRQVISANPVPPSRLNANVPRDLETICLKCLHKEPHLRYASAAALAKDLHHFLRGEAIAARPERWLGRLARRVRRRPVLSAVIVTAILVTVVFVAGGLWLISDRVAAEREVQAERSATERAADEDLREMVMGLNRSLWPEARAALERAKGRLGDHGPDELRRRLNQGSRDLELASQLETIPLDISRDVDQRSYVASSRYKEVFFGAGFGNATDSPDEIAARVRQSDIRTALVDALDHWSGMVADADLRGWILTVTRLADPDPTGWRDRARDPALWANPEALAEVVRTAPIDEQHLQLLLTLERKLPYKSPERLPLLKRIHQAHPGQFWANLKLADGLLNNGKPGEAIRYYQAAVAIRPQVGFGHVRLGNALCMVGRAEDGADSVRRAAEISPESPAIRFLFAQALSSLGRHEEAIHHLKASVRPEFGIVNGYLARSLEIQGRKVEALDQYRLTASKDLVARNHVRAILAQLGRGEEAIAEWQADLKADPPKHEMWHGYSEFCLFLGREEEYRRGRQELFARFGASTEPQIEARTARTCLLRPTTADELNQAASLAERVAANGSPAFLYVRGLAEYRQGRFDQAIATLRGDASKMFSPEPRLVLAMALHQSGQVQEARKTLAATVSGTNWKSSDAINPNAWVWHILRREAESLIFPDLPALLEGNPQPRDNEERLALTGICSFKNHTVALAQLYSDAFATDPRLAEDFRAGHCFRAAGAAALASCGRGEDAQHIQDLERMRWRQQARMWLRQTMDDWSKALDSDPFRYCNEIRGLDRWRGHPDLVGLFDPAELEKLQPEERNDCIALSNEIGRLLARAGIIRASHPDH